jgi:hypothetical protein
MTRQWAARKTVWSLENIHPFRPGTGRFEKRGPATGADWTRAARGDFGRASGITERRCEVMKAAGADIFVSLPDYLTGVTINPATPHAVSYRGEELDGAAPGRRGRLHGAGTKVAVGRVGRKRR